MGEGYGDLAALPPSRSWERVTDIEKRLERCHPHQLRLSSFVAKAPYPLPSKGEGWRRERAPRPNPAAGRRAPSLRSKSQAFTLMKEAAHKCGVMSDVDDKAGEQGGF